MKIGRNQYLIVPQGIEDKFQYNAKLEFGHNYVLLGEKCQTSIIKLANKEILLVGYAINGQNPQDTMDNMLKQLANKLDKDAKNLPDLTLYWGGRWVIFISIKNNLIAMTDCCGLKQLFYAENVFGSQSRYVAYATNKEKNTEATHYIQMAMTIDKEYSWPLDSTLYNEVKRLLPNHLYIRNHVERFKPSEQFSNMGQSERINAISILLKNIVKAATYHAKLAVTLTAGWDSRLVLASCNNVKENTNVLTLKYHHMPNNHIDIEISKQLCKKYGYEYKVLTCNSLNSEFVEDYRNHSENAHDYWIQMAQSIRDYKYENWLWTKGSCNEISRNSSGILYNWQINSRILSKLYGIYPCNYSKAIIEEWLKEAKCYASQTNYSVMDIFYWEHRLGSWLAECLNESDIAGETFTPFNVRAYFELIKYIAVEKRTSPNYLFFQEILKKMDMSLDIPINPHRYDSITAKIKCLIKNKLHIIYGIILNK